MVMDDLEKSAKSQTILDSITQDAFDKTGGDVYETEPPAEPTADSQPAAAPAEDTSASPAVAAESEPTSEPAKLIFGKYKTPEEAERGYFEAVRMGNEAKSRLDTVEKAVAPGPTPAAEDPDAEVELYGMPKEVIGRIVDRRTRAAIAEYFAPAIQATNADKQIVERYPDYAEKFSEIEKFAQSSPEVWQQIEALNGAGQQFAARQIAYLNWKVSTAAQAEETKATAETARKTEAKDTRRDAGVGTSRRADTRTTPEIKGPTAEEEARLLGLYKQGHTAPYLRAKLDGFLGPDFDKAAAQILG
jgi:hypothetical protein